MLRFNSAQILAFEHAALIENAKRMAQLIRSSTHDPDYAKISANCPTGKLVHVCAGFLKEARRYEFSRLGQVLYLMRLVARKPHPIAVRGEILSDRELPPEGRLAALRKRLKD